MRFVIKTAEGKYVQQVKASSEDWKCTSWNVEDAKLFKDEAAVNKYFAFMIGYFTKWQPASAQDSISKLMACEVIRIRVVEVEYSNPIRPSSMKAFEKVLLKRLEEL